MQYHLARNHVMTMTETLETEVSVMRNQFDLLEKEVRKQ